MLLGLTRADDANVINQFVHQDKAMPARFMDMDMHIPQGAVPTAERFRSSHGLVFMGWGGNPTNPASMDWFCEDVFPLLRREHPTLDVYTIGPPPRGGWARNCRGKGKLGFGEKKEVNFHQLGWVEDLDTALLERRVFISPISVGTGVNTKNMAALMHGLPVVTTPVGAQGFKVGEEHGVLTADNAQDFASLCIRVHEDEQLWLRMAAGAVRQVREEQAPEALARDVRRMLGARAFAREVGRRRDTAWQRPLRVPMRPPPDLDDICKSRGGCQNQERMALGSLPYSTNPAFVRTEDEFLTLRYCDQASLTEISKTFISSTTTNRRYPPPRMSD
mmetsp:Transcript_5422/g.18327  ORF Transcript_5422/g.18327 Transcript_5422/m.18327 type:complete len:333 (+) Transcript_5422:819-1817(+)